MNKQNNDKSKIILGIILTVIIILCAIYVEIFNNDNNSENITNNFYSNLNIDKSQLNIFYLNVGQADSILITMGNETMLIDAGNENDGYFISQFLKAQKIEQIDYLIETHSDDDHSGGIKAISQNFIISKVYMPKSAIVKSEIKDYVTINTFDNLEQTYNLDEATWRVLSVDNSEYVKSDEDNNTSIVIQLNYGNTKFLFMGDSEEKVEKNLLKADKLEEVEVLKVAHHGSNSSTSQAFLDKIKPKYSIISVNHEKYKKNPDDRTISRLKSAESMVYRTDEKGTIWITSDGTKSNLRINFLDDVNVNGADKRIGKLESRRYSLIFLL